jgi:hypothetical protein
VHFGSSKKKKKALGGPSFSGKFTARDRESLRIFIPARGCPRRLSRSGFQGPPLASNRDDLLGTKKPSTKTLATGKVCYHFGMTVLDSSWCLLLACHLEEFMDPVEKSSGQKV